MTLADGRFRMSSSHGAPGRGSVLPAAGGRDARCGARSGTGRGALRPKLARSISRDEGNRGRAAVAYASHAFRHG